MAPPPPPTIDNTADRFEINHPDPSFRKTFLNKPFDCVSMRYGDSSECLPELDWSLPSIVWLDYDSRLRQQELADIDRVVENAKHGDCFLITVDADPPKDVSDVEEIKRELRRSAGQLGKPEVLSGWRLADLYYRLADDALRTTLDQLGRALEWRQLFRFHYKDSARMLTLGGVFVDPARSEEFDEGRFDQLPFVVQRGRDPFVILMPQLTLRELRHIERHMPDCLPAALREMDGLGIREEQVERYARIYRHAPTFVESQA
jgi:hypothetical protein